MSDSSSMSSGEAAAIAQAEIQVRARVRRAEEELARAQDARSNLSDWQRWDTSALASLDRHVAEARRELWEAQAAAERFEVDRNAALAAARARKQSEEHPEDQFPDSSSGSGTEGAGTDWSEEAHDSVAQDVQRDVQRAIDEEVKMFSDAMRTAMPEQEEPEERPPIQEEDRARLQQAEQEERLSMQGDRAAVHNARERVSAMRNRQAEMDEAAAKDPSYSEREREADRDRDRAPSPQPDSYDAAADNENSNPATDGLTEIEKEFERLMFKESEFWRLCWSKDDDSGELFRKYVTMDEAEDAFDDGRPIGDGSNIQGETKKCTLRGVPVVIKRHILEGEGATKGYRYGPIADNARFRQAKDEDENHRFIWNSLYLRGYRKLAAKLAYPACMDFSARSGGGFWYTVQTLVDAGPNVRAWSLIDFVEEFGQDGEEVLTMAQRASLAWQYGTMTAAFHTAGVFHNDLHFGNMLVLWPEADWNENTVPQLRVIDWGMGTQGGFKFETDPKTNKLVPCDYPYYSRLDYGWIKNTFGYSDLDNFPARPGITIQEDDVDRPEHARIRKYRKEILDKNGQSMTPKRYCIAERMLGPWAIWMDVPKENKYYLIKRVVVAYKTFLTKDANRLAKEMAKAGHNFSSMQLRSMTRGERTGTVGPPPRGNYCTIM